MEPVNNISKENWNLVPKLRIGFWWYIAEGTQ